MLNFFGVTTDQWSVRCLETSFSTWWPVVPLVLINHPLTTPLYLISSNAQHFSIFEWFVDGKEAVRKLKNVELNTQFIFSQIQIQNNRC